MKKQGRKKRRIVVLCIVAVFVLVMGIWIGTLIGKNNSLENEKQAQLTADKEENAALEALVDEENETALMEEYARKSGYVYPDERVYINGS